MNHSRVSFPIQEKIVFAKRLSLLLKAGIPIVESLVMLREQVSGKRGVFLLDSLAADVSQGKPLSESLVKFRKSFGDFAIYIIQTGERSGRLHENLLYLSEELAKRQLLRKKIIAALIYPLFVAVATVIITLALAFYVFPKIVPVFQNFHFPLPLTTRILMAFTHIVTKYFLVIAGGCILFIGICASLFRTATFRRLWDRLLLKIPVVGLMFRNYFTGNSCRSLGLLLQSGVRIEDALELTGNTNVNSEYQIVFKEISRYVARGEKASVCMSRYQLFPPIVRQMISVGERTGNLSGSFLYLAEIFENEVDELTKNLSSLLEPFLMIGMGIAVGFVAVSIITPIYQITQNLHP